MITSKIRQMIQEINPCYVLFHTEVPAEGNAMLTATWETFSDFRGPEGIKVEENGKERPPLPSEKVWLENEDWGYDKRNILQSLEAEYVRLSERLDIVKKWLKEIEMDEQAYEN